MGKLKISTSTNICNQILWTKTIYNCEDSIKAIAEAGFDAVDIDFAEHGELMDSLGYEKFVEKQKNLADSLNIPINQAHAHFYPIDHCENISDDEYKEHERQIIRDIKAAGLCGVKWIIVHPDSFCDDEWYSKELSLQKNIERFKRFGEVASKSGVSIAIENMFIHHLPCFGAHSDDLLNLTNALNDDKLFGLCLDTGHSHLNGVDQYNTILKMGKRLKALHINDNHGLRDEHILPYNGTIDWNMVLKGLKDVDYQGDFTYEIHNFSKGFDDEFHISAMKFAKSLGDYMVGKL